MPVVSQGSTLSASDGEVFFLPRPGTVDKGMSWSTLADRQRWQLVFYLRSLNNFRVPQTSSSAS
jgi:hypothetical protein